MVSYLDEVAFLGCFKIQELADLVEDVEGCFRVKNDWVLQGIVVDWECYSFYIIAIETHSYHSNPLYKSILVLYNGTG